MQNDIRLKIKSFPCPNKRKPAREEEFETFVKKYAEDEIGAGPDITSRVFQVRHSLPGLSSASVKECVLRIVTTNPEREVEAAAKGFPDTGRGRLIDII